MKFEEVKHQSNWNFKPGDMFKGEDVNGDNPQPGSIYMIVYGSGQYGVLRLETGIIVNTCSTISGLLSYFDGETLTYVGGVLHYKLGDTYEV